MTAADKTVYATREVVLTRVLDAPRELVFRLWTEPGHMAQWWGPKSFTNPVCEMDLRPGGAIRIDMRAPNGVVFPMKGTFREIVRPERLVFETLAIDSDGKPVIEGLTTVTFVETAQGKTELTVRSSGTAVEPIGAQYLAGMDAGWNGSLDKLAELVARKK